MKNEGVGRAKNGQRVELKYCEGCGGLGIRECGGGQVYCDGCASKMAELAVAQKTFRQAQSGLTRQPNLPVGKRSVLDDAADSSDRDFNQPDSNESDLDELDADELNAMAWMAAGGAA